MSLDICIDTIIIYTVCGSHREKTNIIISLIQLALLVLCCEHTAQELVHLQHIYIYIGVTVTKIQL